MTLNTADRKSVRAAEKSAKLADRQRGEVLTTIVETTAGRQYLWDRLEAAHIFRSSFSTDAVQMAFYEGERNQGLLLLGDIMQWCPDQFIQMMREHNERRSTSSRSPTGERAEREDSGRDDSGSGDGEAGGVDPIDDIIDRYQDSIN